MTTCIIIKYKMHIQKNIKNILKTTKKVLNIKYNFTFFNLIYIKSKAKRIQQRMNILKLSDE